MKKVLILCPTQREHRDLPELARALDLELVFDDFCGDYFDRFLVRHPPEDLAPLDILALIDATIERYRHASLGGVTSGVGYPGMSVSSIVARALGLPGPAPAAVLCFEHKYYSRMAQRLHVPDAVPDFRLLDSGEADPIGEAPAFPLFLKPVKSCMSINARRIEDERQLNEVARTARLPQGFVAPFNAMLRANTDFPLDASGLIVESLLEGSQVSLEGYVHRGEVHVLGILDAIMFPGTISFKRFQYPSRLPEPVQERMREIARRLMRATGYDDAPFNIELIHDPRSDRIHIVEVNPKIASQFADLFGKVDGQSSFAVLLALAAGMRPDFAPRRGKFPLAASCVLRSFEDRRVEAVPAPAAIADIVKTHPDALIEVHATPGADLSAQMQDAQSFRYGLVNIGAHSEQEIEEKFARIASRLEFRLAPVRPGAQADRRRRPPKAKTRVLLTVGPGLVAGRRHMTQRALVTALDPRCELLVVPVDGYDLAGGRLRAYRRTRGGRFEDAGMIAPSAELWIVYSDGYYLDQRLLGFRRRRDFFRARLEFHQRQVDRGSVGRVINEPRVEARTLKSWLARLDPDKYAVIPTYRFSSIDEVCDFQAQQGAIVAKLDWGGGGIGARRLLGRQDLRAFEAELALAPDRDLGDYCFQPYRPGDEKRLWFVGGRCVAGRKSRGRPTPWSDSTADYAVHRYDLHSGEEFRADLAAAERLCALAGLEMGSIDFIGDRINEINGCGTIFTEYQRWQCIVDARPALARYLVQLVNDSSAANGARAHAASGTAPAPITPSR